jgi:hypothetical protein
MQHRRVDWKALRTDTIFCEGAEPGPIAVEIGERVKTIPGWLTIDDCGHFALVLRMQSAFGLRGDVVEIGTYHGRSAAALAHFLVEDERLVLADWFDGAPRGGYNDPPTPALLRANIRAACPSIGDARIEIHAGASATLALTRPVRFAHLDGGHLGDEVLGDLRLVGAALLDRGVIAVDDHRNRNFPEVAPAVERFLVEQPQYRVLADLNRHGAVGRKIYLQKFA